MAAAAETVLVLVLGLLLPFLAFAKLEAPVAFAAADAVLPPFFAKFDAPLEAVEVAAPAEDEEVEEEALAVAAVETDVDFVNDAVVVAAVVADETVTVEEATKLLPALLLAAPPPTMTLILGPAAAAPAFINCC